MGKLDGIKHFVLDECDRILESLDMRRDIQEIFRLTPHEKQVMLFSATLSKEIRPVCKKFCQDPMEIYIDDETKLTLHRVQLSQHLHPRWYEAGGAYHPVQVLQGL